MKKLLYTILATLATSLVFGSLYLHYTPSNESEKFSLNKASQDLTPFTNYQIAKVEEVIKEDLVETEKFSRITQQLNLKIIKGQNKNSFVTAENDESSANFKTLKAYHLGDKVVIAQLPEEEGTYIIVDRFRLTEIFIIAVLFLGLALIFSRKKGLGAILGLVFSLLVLSVFVAPNLLLGKEPILVTLVGGGVIAFVSIYIAHGINHKSSLAILATLATLLLATLFAYVAVISTQLMGLGSEQAFYLQAGFLGEINLQGLLLAGIIFGTLGILDDVTTTQVATVSEISSANPALKIKELYQKGLNVGREHIAALINTLVLAYAGAGLPLFLIFYANKKEPLWVLINSEFLAEEIVRALAGSIALILAVPISTLLAAYWFGKENQKTTL